LAFLILVAINVRGCWFQVEIEEFLHRIRVPLVNCQTLKPKKLINSLTSEYSGKYRDSLVREQT